MKGKIAFVLGLVAGYVLGSRAGRERYEQIKVGSAKVWESGPVVKCRSKVTGFVGDRAKNAQNYVVAKGKQVLHAATKPETGK